MDSNRSKLYLELEKQIGEASVYRLENITIPSNNHIFALEAYKFPTGSIWGAVYPLAFKYLEKRGIIIPHVTPVIESTAGNAGAACVWVAQKLGYECSIVLPAETPKSRIEQIEFYGAKVITHGGDHYARGNIALLEKILKEDREKKRGKIGQNPHRLVCIDKGMPYNHKPKGESFLRSPAVDEAMGKIADQIVEQIGGNLGIDYFICGVGSGGTISGIGRRLKYHYPDVRVVAIDPHETPVVYTFKKNPSGYFTTDKMPHEILGCGIFGVPSHKLFIDTNVIDDVRTATKEEWKEGCKMFSEYENLQVGRSSGAGLIKALEIANETEGKNLLMIIHDQSWKYTEKMPDSLRELKKEEK